MLRDRALELQLVRSLGDFQKEVRPIPGITTPERRAAFIGQIVESVRRIRYISVISERKLTPLRSDPTSVLFDPIQAAVLHRRAGEIDEAFWLVFLSVHFGKNLRTGWNLARNVYAGAGSGGHWDWERTSADPGAFRKWLDAHEKILSSGATPGRFGNHRKYQSLSATSPSGTGAAFETYIRWVNPPDTHEVLISDARSAVGPHPRKMFDHLYRSMKAVASFGRTARFDYLTMIGKLSLATIEAGSTYMQGATGPLTGARLLFTGNETGDLSRVSADAFVIELEAFLRVGMQVMEDSLCNWQKSPDAFKAFRG